MARHVGAKIVVRVAADVLVYRRDVRPGLIFAGLWDIPGGGAEAGERARETAVRELREETGLVVARRELAALGRYEAERGGWISLFELQPDHRPALRPGDEGTDWRFEPLADFLARADGVRPLQRAMIRLMT